MGGPPPQQKLSAQHIAPFPSFNTRRNRIDETKVRCWCQSVSRMRAPRIGDTRYTDRIKVQSGDIGASGYVRRNKHHACRPQNRTPRRAPHGGREISTFLPTAGERRSPMQSIFRSQTPRYRAYGLRRQEKPAAGDNESPPQAKKFESHS